jgi:hypothetical protein
MGRQKRNMTSWVMFDRSSGGFGDGCGNYVKGVILSKIRLLQRCTIRVTAFHGLTQPR